MHNPGARMWKAILEFCLTLWVVRPAVIVLILGSILMWFIPQAQDLLIELASPASFWSSLARTSWLLALVFVAWAMPTHYSARLLLRNDARYQAKFNSAVVGVGTMERWVPRALGTLAFVVMLGGVYRAWLNLPLISDVREIARIDSHLVRIAVAVVFAGTVFLIYTIERKKLAQTRAVVAAEKLIG